MPPLPFQLRYTLTRMQRLAPLLSIWGWVFTPIVLFGFLFFCVQTVVQTYLLSGLGAAMFGFLALFMFLLHRGLFVGLLDVLFVPVRHVDIIIEENALGILIGEERWYLFLDGLLSITQFRADTWTLQHCNGCVVHIAASALSDEYLAYFRERMEFGRTEEGFRAVIERGRRIAEIEDSDRKA